MNIPTHVPKSAIARGEAYVMEHVSFGVDAVDMILGSLKQSWEAFRSTTDVAKRRELGRKVNDLATTLNTLVDEYEAV